MTYIIFSIITFILTYLGIFHFLPDFYWFQSFQYEHIFIKTLVYKSSVFIASLIPIAILYLINQKVLDHVLEKSQVVHDDMPSSPVILRIKQIIQAFFGSYEAAKLSISKSIKIIIYLGVSLLIARVFSYYWNDIILSLHHNPFSINDPVFNKNISFYIFKLPVFKQIIGILKFIAFTVLLFSLWNYLKRGYFTLFFS